jgi:type I restriction-modification system DNA methylase subunit
MTTAALQLLPFAPLAATIETLYTSTSTVRVSWMMSILHKQSYEDTLGQQSDSTSNDRSNQQLAAKTSSA